MPSNNIFLKDYFYSLLIFVLISGGASNCSLFACLCILFNQLFIYEHIDICRLVRIIKPQKQNLFPSYVSIFRIKHFLK